MSNFSRISASAEACGRITRLCKSPEALLGWNFRSSTCSPTASACSHGRITADDLDVLFFLNSSQQLRQRIYSQRAIFRDPCAHREAVGSVASVAHSITWLLSGPLGTNSDQSAPPHTEGKARIVGVTEPENIHLDWRYRHRLGRVLPRWIE